MTMQDFVEEIKRIWQINQPEFDITFTEDSGRPHTTARLVDGRLHVYVSGDPSEDKIILYHEGAHVYLFHLGYPVLRTGDNWVIPKLMGCLVDFLAEDYVLQMELSKKFNSLRERLEELQGRWKGVISDVPILGERQLQPGDGKLAIKAAVCTHVLREWGKFEEARQTEAKMKTSFNDLAEIYCEVLSALHQAPRLPQGSNRFTGREVSMIKTVLAFSINNLYGSSCTFEFLWSRRNYKTLVH